MEILSNHIEYLLQRKDCVILPGLGAFMASKHPAHIDIERNMIFPPYREISWNALVNNDDGTLAHSYARRLGCNFEQGRLHVKEVISKLKDELYKEREITLGNLGMLMLQEDDAIVFTPMYSAQRVAERMGQCALSLPGEKTDIENPISEPAPVASETNSKYINLRISKVAIRVAAAVILAIISAAGLWLAGSKFDNIIAPEEVQTANVVPIKIEVPIALESSSNEVADNNITSSEEGNTYHLIVGTFHKRAQAENFIKQHSASGFILHIIEGKNIYRISCADGTTAESLLPQLRDKATKEEFGQPWIFCSAERN